jgi:hypothetical protein
MTKQRLLGIIRDAIPMMEHFDGYPWIFRDVTAEKEAERKLQKANQILKEPSLLDGLNVNVVFLIIRF